MKNFRKPTRKQKIIISEHRLNPDNWLIISENESEMVIYNKLKNNTRVIHK